ncbi:MAG: hypothetical protein K5855_05580 [Oscillospiraceae bacterium]|jgi:hypothetical protein|nr:hypothetical protein [Oscillospiraceae bacterium]
MSTFFLGANSFKGFYSLYGDYFRPGPSERLYVIKGGPGGGKSGFMRAIARSAESRGLKVIRLLCSGDPASLDGIRIPQLGLMFADGTAPHVLEPDCVGERGAYIDLSRFCRMDVVGAAELSGEYREHYRRAYCILAAAGSVFASIRLPEACLDEIASRAEGIINREIKRKSRVPGHAERLFTDAFTCLGPVSLSETRSELCGKLISLDNEYGAAAHFLEILSRAAVGRGYDVIICLSPLDPDRIFHLLIPELSLGFVSGRGGRRLHLDKTVAAHMSPEEIGAAKEALSEYSRLLSMAQERLRLAKAAHDRLEAAVNPHVDFDGVYALAARYIDELAIERV